MKNLNHLWIAFIVILSTSISLSGQPDQCVNAEVITVAPSGTNTQIPCVNIPFDFSLATDSCNDPMPAPPIGTDCSFSFGVCPPGNCVPDYWITFVIPPTEVIFFESDFSNNGGSSTILSEYFTGSCGSLVPLPGSSCPSLNGNGLVDGDGIVTFPAGSAGTNAYVRIWDLGCDPLVGTGMTIDLCIAEVNAPPPPPEDECVNAVSIPVEPIGTSSTAIPCASIAGGFESATNSCNDAVPAPPTSCGETFGTCPGGGCVYDYWVSFVVPATEIILFNSTFPNNGGASNIIWELYSGTCNALVSTGLCGGGFGPGLVYLPIGSAGSTFYARLYSDDCELTNLGESIDLCIVEFDPPPPPPEDECVNALPVTLAPLGTDPSLAVCGSIPTGFIAATNSCNDPIPAPPTLCGADGGNCPGGGCVLDYWISFAVPPSESITFSSFVGSDGGAFLQSWEFFTGSCNALVPLSCQVFDGIVNFAPGSAGTTIYIRLYAFDCDINDLNAGPIDFCIAEYDPPPPAPEDECVNALLVTLAPVGTDPSAASCGQINGGFASATDSCNDPIPAPPVNFTCSGTGGDCPGGGCVLDYWISFVIPSSELIEYNNDFFNDGGASTITWEFFTGTCNALIPVPGAPCTNSTANNNVTFPAGSAGTIAYVRMWDFSCNPNAGEDIIEFCIAELEPPINENCDEAIDLCNIEDTMGTTVASSIQNVPTCGAGSTSPGVWYTFTTGVNGPISIDLCDGFTNFNSKLTVYEADNCQDINNGQCVADNNNFCGAQSSVSFNATAGTSYYVLVHGFGGDSGSFNLVISGDTCICSSTHGAINIKAIPAPGN